MVLVAAIVEYLLHKKTSQHLDKAITQASFIGASGGADIPTNEKYIGLVAHIFIILGTFIWGYGDFLI